MPNRVSFSKRQPIKSSQVVQVPLPRSTQNVRKAQASADKALRTSQEAVRLLRAQQAAKQTSNARSRAVRRQERPRNAVQPARYPKRLKTMSTQDPLYNKRFALHAKPGMIVPNPVCNQSVSPIPYKAAAGSARSAHVIGAGLMLIIMPTPQADKPYVCWLEGPTNALPSLTNNSHADPDFRDHASATSDDITWLGGDPRELATGHLGSSHMEFVVGATGNVNNEDKDISFQQFMGGYVRATAALPWTGKMTVYTCDDSSLRDQYGSHFGHGFSTLDMNNGTVANIVDSGKGMAQDYPSMGVMRWRNPVFGLANTYLELAGSLKPDLHTGTATPDVHVLMTPSPTSQGWVPYTGFKQPGYFGNSLIGGCPYTLTNDVAFRYGQGFTIMHNTSTEDITVIVDAFAAYNVTIPGGQANSVAKLHRPSAPRLTPHPIMPTPACSVSGGSAQMVSCSISDRSNQIINMTPNSTQDGSASIVAQPTLRPDATTSIVADTAKEHGGLHWYDSVLNYGSKLFALGQQGADIYATLKGNRVEIAHEGGFTDENPMPKGYYPQLPMLEMAQPRSSSGRYTQAQIVG